MNIAVLGAGAWGSALASSLANRHRVTLWGRDELLMSSMAQTFYNTTYLTGTRLHPDLKFCHRFEQVMAEHSHADDVLIIATPLAALRGVCQKIAKANTQASVLWLCKGVERETLALPHQIVAEVLGVDAPVGALSGPSFAAEVAQNQPCALVLASLHPRLNMDFVQQLHHAHLRIYHSTDVIGVEIGGALKNVLAIAAGICDGLELGMNARAALITRGIAEMMRLGQALGAQTATLSGLTGVGDLILTATGHLSRNRKVGLALAAGASLQDITAGLGHVAEGALCAHAMLALARQHQVDLPITQAVCAVLDGLPPKEAVQQLLMREAASESIRL
ncbi:NAD(P)H-dependent glycerol-3-phosphate dehydrogenase [Hydromonas duriensis]|uniref:Glycerol-3-phosphate dehydrogenase [NAD(P)+] n=1 Tax=Hydromonas duriensis TaxID=1527608 RepID=A0A4R6Y7Z5_9BURK|nr:NAD(P)H-dependent glycerol-3-phosphate dehydrogenase [Hydromonas duriensis]TDR31494.1 glycerol-3-phosphate dehydrogenase (NAD(P)+) [Hydromonas duriensis]